MKKGKRIKRRIRRRRIILRFFLSILLLVLLYLFVFKTDFFIIKDIRVMGTQGMDPEQVIGASHCVKGENIFRIKKRACEEAIKSLPYVKDCQVKRDFPDGITIRIEERKKVAVISNTDAFIYIDNEGYILSIDKKKGEDGDIGYPQIIGIELSKAKVTDNVFHMLDIRKMEEFIDAGIGAKLFSQIESIDCSDKNNIVLELKSGIKVAFGSLYNVKYKYSFLYHILEDVKREDMDIRQILFNKGDNPVIITGNQ